ncbi:hypothetical protein CMEL01_16765 [Colletotrichum melonis]|uniref:Uncharacterized protein n=1 Tax=Colletotrichum melonis TaxID=1209925 RepID=A0AAI9XJH6_9PEZI|nr:hypothetical protein CMEL01_16765 [Colletotrichum melonis]
MISLRQARLTFLRFTAFAILASFGWSRPSRIEQVWETTVMSSYNDTQPATALVLGPDKAWKEAVDPVLANAIGKDSFNARLNAAVAADGWKLGGFGISKQKRRGARPGRSAM